MLFYQFWFFVGSVLVGMSIGPLLYKEAIDEYIVPIVIISSIMEFIIGLFTIFTAALYLWR